MGAHTARSAHSLACAAYGRCRRPDSAICRGHGPVARQRTCLALDARGQAAALRRGLLDPHHAATASGQSRRRRAGSSRSSRSAMPTTFGESHSTASANIASRSVPFAPACRASRPHACTAASRTPSWRTERVNVERARFALRWSVSTALARSSPVLLRRVARDGPGHRGRFQHSGRDRDRQSDQGRDLRDLVIPSVLDGIADRLHPAQLRRRSRVASDLAKRVEGQADHGVVASGTTQARADRRVARPPKPACERGMSAIG